MSIKYAPCLGPAGWHGATLEGGVSNISTRVMGTNLTGTSMESCSIRRHVVDTLIKSRVRETENRSIGSLTPLYTFN